MEKSGVAYATGTETPEIERPIREDNSNKEGKNKGGFRAFQGRGRAVGGSQSCDDNDNNFDGEVNNYYYKIICCVY